MSHLVKQHSMPYPTEEIRDRALTRLHTIRDLRQKKRRSLVDRVGRTINYLRSRKLTCEATLVAMSEQWGRKNCWQHRADVPKDRESEEPFSIRKLLMEQKSHEYATFMLERGQVGAINMKGQKPGNEVGQDSLSISCLQGIYTDDLWELYVVADGHGPGAHLIADRVVQTLPFFMGTHECQQHLADGDIQMALSKAFKRTEADLYEGQSCYDEFAGTTVTAILRGVDGCFYVACAGDSRAIMFSESGTVLFETTDHTPDLPEERERIEAAGGLCVEAEDYVGARVFDPDSDLTYPGLAMSRSLGDACAKELGVSAEPEIHKWQASEQAYVLVASDGVWEFLSNSDVADFLGAMLRARTPPMEAVQELLHKAKEEWLNHGEDYGEDYVDDITAILIPTGSQFRPQSSDSRIGGCECFSSIYQILMPNEKKSRKLVESYDLDDTVVGA